MRSRHFEDGPQAAADLGLTREEIAAIEEAVPEGAVAGDRYAEAELSLVGR